MDKWVAFWRTTCLAHNTPAGRTLVTTSTKSIPGRLGALEICCCTICPQVELEWIPSCQLWWTQQSSARSTSGHALNPALYGSDKGNSRAEQMAQSLLTTLNYSWFLPQCMILHLRKATILFYTHVNCYNSPDCTVLSFPPPQHPQFKLMCLALFDTRTRQRSSKLLQHYVFAKYLNSKHLQNSHHNWTHPIC